ncbi:DUF2971 domain-containing protein [Bacteroides propionicifaciens]|uniref:DUF2971 domain-containing protein n=1 Tax=Bacteroides propionicifaciens TaxID=392838 RepID=UPI000375BAC7|nr:DUF2971 domain-containing protein [Bacteroides propionicifaciens]
MMKYTFENVIGIIKKHLELIDWEKEKFSCEPFYKTEYDNDIIVKYENKEFVRFGFYISNVFTPDGRRQIRGSITIELFNYSKWYHIGNISVNVDEFLTCGHNNGKSIMLDDELNRVLPISNSDEVTKIKDQFQKESISNLEIKFDTLNKRYIILGDLSLLLIDGGETSGQEDKNTLYLYKYMSLDTYYSMLNNNSFRMNSIVAMNDESESFFLDDGITNIYDGEGKDEKYLKTVENSRILITSFTDQHDSALMWRLYGDSGRGVCLSFIVPKNKVKKIHYVNTRSEGYQKLKRCVDNLKKEGISLYFKDFDNFKYYAKSDGFKYEDEYRLSYRCTEEDLKWAKYGNLLSPYKDFNISNQEIKEIDIKLSWLIIGAKLPNFSVNYPLLVDMTNRKFGISVINISEHDKFRE